MKKLILFCLLLFFALLSPNPYTLTPTFAVNTCTTTTTGKQIIQNGLVTSPSLGQNIITSAGFCVIDPKAAFTPQLIPTFDNLKSNYYTKAKTTSSIEKHSALSGDKTNSDIPMTTGKDRLYNITGNLTIEGNISGNQTGIVFVDKDLTINSNITHGNANSGLVFIVKGNVNILSTVTTIDAIIISAGVICTAYNESSCPDTNIATSKLTINGSLISIYKNASSTDTCSISPNASGCPAIKFKRNLGDASNTTDPSEKINYEVKYLVIMRHLFSDIFQRWWESDASAPITPDAAPVAAAVTTAVTAPTPAPTATATGGNTIDYIGGYAIHTFTTSGTFTPSENMTVDVLVVAGGGGGGADAGGGNGGGGGGGGGVREKSSVTVTAQSYTVTVGNGGTAGPGLQGGDGGDSVFNTVTANGGGGGGLVRGTAGDTVNGRIGGSGGGGSGQNDYPYTGNTAGGSGNEGGFSPVAGYAGGNGGQDNSYRGAGGGGASAVGQNGGAGGGNGGAGYTTSISGSSVTYGGGGGGGATAGGGTGGSGGGGNGGTAGTGQNGTANTGGGGGGGAIGAGATGGSGIVVIRYLGNPPITTTATIGTTSLLPPTAYRAFVTSTDYNGNLGGISGADSKCQARADAVNLGGVWKAWISNSTTLVNDRFYHSPIPYELIDGTQIAGSWGDLVDGTLNNPINLGEDENIPTEPYNYNYVWTGTNFNGSKMVKISGCSDWNSTTAGGSSVGTFSSVGPEWTHAGGDGNGCASKNYLYCFEQPACNPGIAINGCFKDPENPLANWSCSGDGANVGSCIKDSETKNSADYSAKVTSTGSGWGWQLSQSGISAASGDSFCLSAMVLQDIGNVESRIAIQESASPWRESYITAPSNPTATRISAFVWKEADNPSWNLVRGTVTVGAGWTTPIQVYGRTVLGTAWFDDISLTRGACL